MKSEYEYSLLKEIGDDTFISSKVEIRRPHLVAIGSHVAIDSGFYLTTAARIENYIHIGPYVTCIGGASAEIIIKNFATIAAGARLICLGDEYLGFGIVGPTIPTEFRDQLVGGQITLEEYSSIGTNAIVFPGIKVATGSVIAAGSVLTKDTEPWVVYAGSPARALMPRKKEKMLKYGSTLLQELVQKG
jgi:acetyltransferase-like isoleucine patch superfamily enzyme